MTENTDLTVLEKLRDHVVKTPGRTAVIYEPDERMTYEQLWELSGRIYAWLKKRKIGAEDIVMYCLPRGTGLYACIVGTMRAGAAFVLTESGNEKKRTEYIRKDCGCSLYVDESSWNDILKTQPIEGYEDIRLQALCYIAYTSGTTGQPKGVLHEYGSLENAWKSARLDQVPLLSENDTFLAMSPMNFVSLPIIFAFSSAFGNAVALMPYSYAENERSFDDYLDKTGVNCGYVTPSFLRSHLPFSHPWKMCILSSEPADGLFLPDIKCYNCYASTESGCLLAVCLLHQPVTPAPVGKSQSDIQLFILDEDEMEVPDGTVGEICYRNPYVRGYLNLPEKTRKLLRGRVFHSGDTGMIDSDKNLIVRGRLDERFKIGGYRIEPDEVAGAVRAASGLQHLVVRGFVYKDISSIVVFYTDDMEIDDVVMRQKLLKLLPEYMIPTNYIHLRDFPLLETGKLDKLSLLPPEGSWDMFRKINASGFPVIGKGRTSSVYDLMEGKVMKLYRPSIPFEMIRQELILTQAAHSNGIRVPEAYEILRSGSGYGILMDKAGGIELEAAIKEHPENRTELIVRFAEAVRGLHQVKVQDERVPDVRSVSISLAEQLDPSFCTKKEAEKIRKVFECIPPSDSFIHGDCHPGNVMIDKDNMQFIDMMLCGKGHPVFDLLCMYSHYIFLPSFVSDKICISRLGMNKAQAAELYDLFLDTYFSADRETDISEVKNRIMGIHAARICLASVIMPGIFTGEVLREAKTRAILFSEKYCSDKGYTEDNYDRK